MVSSGKRTPNKEFPRRQRSSISSRTEQGNQARRTKNQITTRRSKQSLPLTQKTRTFSQDKNRSLRRQNRRLQTLQLLPQCYGDRQALPLRPGAHTRIRQV